MAALVDLSFEDWVEHAFGHEVRLYGDAWHFDNDADWWDPHPAVAVDYLTRLFSEPEEALAWFSDDQIAQGLTYLVSTSASGDNGWLYSRHVSAAYRIACVDSVYRLFASLFAPRCAPVLSHIDEPGRAPLNLVCYMWWDEFPCVALPDDPDRAALERATITCMGRILGLEQVACQEAALHGLGHSARRHGPEVEALIDGFVADGRPKRAELITYARSARCGCVL